MISAVGNVAFSSWKCHAFKNSFDIGVIKKKHKTFSSFYDLLCATFPSFYLLLIFVVLRTIKGLCQVNFDSFIRRHKNSLILGIWYQLIIESITSRCSVLHQLQYLWIFWTLSDNWDTLSRIVFLFLFYFPFTLLFCHSSTFLRWANVWISIA